MVSQIWVNLHRVWWALWWGFKCGTTCTHK